MSLTVNLKPDGFRPVGGGELLYTFTESTLSGKSNYRVNIWLNGLSSIVPIAEFRPDQNLDIEADIAPLLRAALAFNPDDRFVTTYVEYQAVWDEGSDTAVALSGDVIYAYVGVNHRLNNRTQFEITTGGGQFLIPSTKLHVWEDRTAYIDFLYSGLDANTGLYFTPTGGAETLIDSADLSGNGLKSWSSDSVWTAGGTLVLRKVAAPYTQYATIDVVLEEECNNPVYLKWINDLGGLSTWLFSYNQIYELVPSSPLYRLNNQLLVADVLSIDVWQMLQELNKDGIEYGDNRKSGTYCVDFTDETNPIYLFPVPTARQTETRRRTHSFELTVRYPQIPGIQL